MTYDLTIKERLVLASTLPPEGNFLLMKRSRELREALTFFTDEDVKRLGLRVDELGTHWNPEMSGLTFPMEIGEMMGDHITKLLKQKDEQNALTDDLLSLYEKFVGE